jgi:hypothetical protein
VYVAGFLSHKHNIQDPSAAFSTEFLDSLNRGGLTVPTLNVVFFVHLVVIIHELLPKSEKYCHRYVTKWFQYIDVPFSIDDKIARTTFNLSQAY